MSFNLIEPLEGEDGMDVRSIWPLQNKQKYDYLAFLEFLREIDVKLRALIGILMIRLKYSDVSQFCAVDRCTYFTTNFQN